MNTITIHKLTTENGSKKKFHSAKLNSNTTETEITQCSGTRNFDDKESSTSISASEKVETLKETLNINMKKLEKNKKG